MPTQEVDWDGLDQDCDGQVDEGPELSSYNPSLAFDGEHYAAVWIEQTGRMAFARIDPGGVRRAYSEPFPIAAASTGMMHPQIAWNGEHFGVLAGTHERRDRRYSIYGLIFARLDRDGAVLEQHAISDDSCGYAATLRWDGGRFYRQSSPYDRGTTSHLVARDGAAPEIVPIPEIPPAGRCTDTQHAAWNGGGYGVVWVRGPADADHELRFARLTATGAFIGGSERSVLTVPEGSSAHLVWNGTGYIVLASSGRDLLELDAMGSIVGQRRLDDVLDPLRVTPLVRLSDGALFFGWVAQGVARGVSVVTDPLVTPHELATGRYVGRIPGQLAAGDAGEIGVAFSMYPAERDEVFFARMTIDGPTLGPFQVSND